MDITGPNLEILRQGFQTAFQDGLVGRQKTSQFQDVVLRTNSMTREEHYGWMRTLPGMRRWVGDRVLQQISRQTFSIVNEDYEDTLVVDRNDITDDQYGVYGARFRALGQAAASHPDEVVWPLLNAGFGDDEGLCFDGQYFFDTDHPYEKADGSMATQANTDGGAGTAWFLMDGRTPILRPIVWQVRQEPQLTAMTDPADEAVFSRREFRYGVDCRDAAGFGFYQGTWGSKQDLSADNYATGRRRVMEMRGDGGRPLGLVPNKLIVPPALEGKARKVVQNERLVNGETNEWLGTAEVVVVPWLAA